MGRDLLAPGWSWETEGRVRASRHQSFSARVHFNQSESSGGFSAAAFTAGLLERSARSFSQKELIEIQSLSQEADLEMLFTGMLQFGQRLQNRGKLELAAEVYAAIVGAGLVSAPLQGYQGKATSDSILERRALGRTQGPPLQIIEQAQKSLDAILGKGSAGLRAEVLIRGFAEAATDYRMILPMIAGSAVYQLTKTATFGRLALSTQANWFTRGLGARLTSASAGFLLEVPTFSLMSRGLTQLGGEELAWDAKAVGKDLLGAAITLGTLKVSGWAGNQAVRRVHGQGVQKFSQIAVPQASMFVGLLAAHRFEETVGLRPHVDGATAVTDTLATMLSLGVGARLGHAFLGPKFSEFQGELALRTKIKTNQAVHLSLGIAGNARGLEKIPFEAAGSIFPTRFAMAADNKDGGGTEIQRPPGKQLALDLVGSLHEIRNAGPELSGAAAGKALQFFLSQRRLPAGFQEAMLKLLWDTYLAPAKMLDDPPETYFTELAELYLQHRAEILQAPEFTPLEDSSPLSLATIPKHLRKRMEQEAPEFDLIDDQKYLAQGAPELRFSDLLETDLKFLKRADNYLMLKGFLLAVAFGRNPALEPLTKTWIKDFEVVFNYMIGQFRAGGSPSHVAAWSTNALFKAHADHRPTLLPALAQAFGWENLLYHFPEIRDQDLPYIPLVPGWPKPLLTPSPDSKVLTEVLQILQKGFSDSEHGRNLEKILWETKTQMQDVTISLETESLRSRAQRLMQYYWEHRDFFLTIPKKLSSLDLEELAKADREALEAFPELEKLNLEEIQVKQRQDRQFLNLLKKEVGWGEPQEFIFLFGRPPDPEMFQVVDEKGKAELFAQLQKGLVIRLKDHPDQTFSIHDLIEVVEITPDILMSFMFKNWYSPYLHRLVVWGQQHQGFADEHNADMLRASDLLLLGVDPTWVLTTFRERLIQSYQKYRKDILRP